MIFQLTIDSIDSNQSNQLIEAARIVSAIYGATLNSLLHVVMYTYYGLTALNPHARIWWKKYLTALQLVRPFLVPSIIRRMGSNRLLQTQFCIALVLGTIGLYVDCPFPKWMGYTLVAYMLSFIVLFSNFWKHAYGKKVA